MIPAVVERSPLRGSPRCGFHTDSKKAFMINTSVNARLGAIFVWIQYSIRKKEQQAPLLNAQDDCMSKQFVNDRDS